MFLTPQAELIFNRVVAFLRANPTQESSLRYIVQECHPYQFSASLQADLIRDTQRALHILRDMKLAGARKPSIRANELWSWIID